MRTEVRRLLRPSWTKLSFRVLVIRYYFISFGMEMYFWGGMVQWKLVAKCLTRSVDTLKRHFIVRSFCNAFDTCGCNTRLEISSFSHDFGLRGSAVFKHFTLQMFLKRAKKRIGTAENFCRRMSLDQRPPRLRSDGPFARIYCFSHLGGRFHSKFALFPAWRCPHGVTTGSKSHATRMGAPSVSGASAAPLCAFRLTAVAEIFTGWSRFSL